MPDGGRGAEGVGGVCPGVQPGPGGHAGGRPPGSAADRLRLCHDLLDAIAAHRVGDRPDRYEPRVKKRKRNHYGWLTRTRAEMKRKMAKGLTNN